MYGIAHLHEPGSLSEALEILAQNSGAKVIAGGTDLLLKIRKQGLKDVTLVSLRKIQELAQIEELSPERIKIGAMITFKQLNQNPLLRDKVNFLAQAAGTMGGPQIRNVATIGGNLCNGAPSADGAPSLLALDARLNLLSQKGQREIPLEEFYLGPSRVDLKPGEVLTSLSIPSLAQGRWGGYYYKFSMRKAMDISTLGCAVLCRLNDSGRLEDLRIALGTAAPTPIRCRKAEKLALNQKPSLELLAEIGNAAAQEADPRSSWRASREFRLKLIGELTARTLVQAYRNAGGEYQDENY